MTVCELRGGARAWHRGLTSIQGEELTPHLSWNAMGPHYLARKLAQSPQRHTQNHRSHTPVLNLLQRTSKAKQEHGKSNLRVYVTCNLKELKVFDSNQG